MSANLLADSNIKFIRAISVSVNYPAISTITTESNAVAIPGLRIGDLVIAFPNVHIAGAAQCSALPVVADGTVDLIATNPTAATVDPVVGVWTLLVFRPESVDSGGLNAG